MIHIESRRDVSRLRLECDLCDALSPTLAIAAKPHSLFLRTSRLRSEAADLGWVWCGLTPSEVGGPGRPVHLCPDCLREEIVRRREEAR